MALASGVFCCLKEHAMGRALTIRTVTAMRDSAGVRVAERQGR
jgi:hypothetical protein